MSPSSVPSIRRRVPSPHGPKPNGDYVLYWMVAQRRTEWNFALDRAAELAVELAKPLLVFEPLRCGYAWASDRLHRFLLQGMADNARRCADAGVTYFAYVEPEEGHGSGLLEALADRACTVVTDEYPCFFLPRMVAAAVSRLTVHVEVVDSNGLLPLRSAPKAFSRAVDFRRFLQKELASHLTLRPRPSGLERVGELGRATVPDTLTARWPNHAPGLARGAGPTLADLPIDHKVPVCADAGGPVAAGARLDQFLDDRLARYVDDRLDLDRPAASELSAYLHFGHLSVHEVFDRLASHESWTPDAVADPPYRGKREGWWGMGEAAEAFLDELVTWRELSFNGAAMIPHYDRYGSLPDWARKTLAEHATDPRPHLYDLEQLDAAATYDEVWNAAQVQLREEGRIHNYLRMLWGKKILEWSPDPQTALDVMIELNNKYALDGRDPCSYSGIFWCLGRYDRAWGPERPIFGKIRYMSSDSTRRKTNLKGYLERFAPSGQRRLL